MKKINKTPDITSITFLIPLKHRKNAETIQNFAAYMVTKWQNRLVQYSTMVWDDDNERALRINNALERIEVWGYAYNNPQTILDKIKAKMEV